MGCSTVAISYTLSVLTLDQVMRDKGHWYNFIVSIPVNLICQSCELQLVDFC